MSPLVYDPSILDITYSRILNLEVSPSSQFLICCPDAGLWAWQLVTDVHHSLKGTPGCQTLIKQDPVSALEKAGWTDYFSFLVSSGRPTFKKKKKNINKKSESWWAKAYNDLPSSGQSNLSMSSRNAASLLLRLICLFAAYRAAISVLEREQSKALKSIWSFFPFKKKYFPIYQKWYWFLFSNL